MTTEAKGFEDGCLGTPPCAPFVRRDTLSRSGNPARQFVDLWTNCCLLGPLGGSSSSSLLKVRSTTWPVDRLLLGGGSGTAEIDCSLDEIGGVRISPGSRDTSDLTEASRGRSRISTRSSSPSLLVRSLLVLGDGAPPAVLDHTPFGSIVICSTDFGVDCNIFATYLWAHLSYSPLTDTKGCILVNLEMLISSGLVTYGAGPRRGLFLELKERRGVETLIVTADRRTAGHINPQSRQWTL